MNTIQMAPKSYGPEADKWLASFYESRRVETTQQKIELLQTELGQPPSNYYAYGGSINEEMKLGCLEYDYLEMKGQITLVLA